MAIVALLSMLSAFTAGGDTGRGPVRPVPAVDLARYAGRWYEIARYE